MTPDQIRALLKRNVGKRITLESHKAILSGVIHGVDDQRRNVLVARLHTVPKGKGQQPYDAPQGHIDRWGTPRQNIEPRREGGKTVFQWREQNFGEWYDYKLTIQI